MAPELISPTVLTEVAEIVVPDGHAQPAPARYGVLGACAACKQPAATHFDTAGRFIGCPEATIDTTFILMPVQRSQPAGRGEGLGQRRRATPANGAAKKAVPAAARTRRYGRARYIATLPRGKTIDTLDLGSEQRLKVLRPIVEAKKGGLRTSEIITKTGLKRGTVGGVLAWLNEQHMVQAISDTES